MVHFSVENPCDSIITLHAQSPWKIVANRVLDIVLLVRISDIFTIEPEVGKYVSVYVYVCCISFLGWFRDYERSDLILNSRLLV